MGYSQVMYDSRVVTYDRRAFIRLTTGVKSGLGRIIHQGLFIQV